MTSQPLVAIQPQQSAPVPVPSRAEVEHGLVEILSGLLAGRDIAAESHFFDDLGANSMTMAQFCARVRKRPDLPAVSIRDIYAHPSVRSLASTLVSESEEASSVQAVVVEPELVRGSSVQFALCGIAQLVIFLAYSWVVVSGGVVAYGWIAAGGTPVDIYVRAVLAGGACFLVACLFPVVLKWTLIGRWTACEFPLWGWRYLQFWTVRMLLQVNPMILFVGSPIFVGYLRLLGTKVGPGAVVLSRSIPVCTDLVSIGARAVIRKDSVFRGYRAEAGRIVTGSVRVGDSSFVGEKTVLDIDVEIGSGAQLGHSSSLQSGERIPNGEHWHGAPAEPTQVDYQRVTGLAPARLRTIGYVVGSLLNIFLLGIPLSSAGLLILLSGVPQLANLIQPDVAAWSLLLEAAALSLTVMLVIGVVGLLFTLTVPRLLALPVRPGVVYPLYGVHYSLHSAVVRLTNRRLYTWLFGDSSYIVGYLRRLGYRFTHIEQTGSNFGTDVQHETPFHVTMGGGTMVADGLSVLNAEYSASSFMISPVSIGAHSFLGNNIAFPAGGRTGENVLLATKVMVPLDGPLREGVGLLGSPPFEIPRTVERDANFDYLRQGAEFDRRLAAKNRYNIRSMIMMSLVRWLDVFLVALLGLLLLEGPDNALGGLMVAAYVPLSLLLSAAYFVLVERLICRFRPLQPQLCSIYEPYFWWHERLWKVPDLYLNLFSGTPMKSLIWRSLGVKTGRRVFDDGCYITERSLASIGDDAVLNFGSKIQCHSQEDGTFKSDRTSIGAGATLHVGAFIHYGVTVGAAAVVSADAFVMKGTEVPERERWGGNPATAVRGTVAAIEPAVVAGQL